MEKEKQIKEYMEKLDLTYDEALQLWEDDKDDYIGEDGEEMQKKAKEVAKHYEKDVKKKRKPSTKERKVDSEKLEILRLCQGILEENGVVATIEKEIAIHFNLNDTDYTLKLVKHRAKK